MRAFMTLALLLSACGGAEPTTEPTAITPEGTEAVAEADAPQATQAAAATTGTVSCDQFADHMLETLETQAEAAGDNEFMTVAQTKEFAGSMVSGVRTGCKSNDRLSEFPEVVGCFMAASDEASFAACKTKPKSDLFDEYMKGLLASAMQIDLAE